MGSRQQLQHTVRSVDEVRCRFVRSEHSLEHRRSSLRAVRGGNLHRFCKRDELRRVDSLRSRKLRKHRRHAIKRSHVCGLFFRHVFIFRQPAFVHAHQCLPRGHLANGGQYRNIDHALHDVQHRRLLRRRHGDPGYLHR